MPLKNMTARRSVLDTTVLRVAATHGCRAPAIIISCTILHNGGSLAEANSSRNPNPSNYLYEIGFDSQKNRPNLGTRRRNLPASYLSQVEFL
jgi:hypothetical protein